MSLAIEEPWEAACPWSSLSLRGRRKGSRWMQGRQLGSRDHRAWRGNERECLPYLVWGRLWSLRCGCLSCSSWQTLWYKFTGIDWTLDRRQPRALWLEAGSFSPLATSLRRLEELADCQWPVWTLDSVLLSRSQGLSCLSRHHQQRDLTVLFKMVSARGSMICFLKLRSNSW